jgi:hypothetical protein
LLFSPSFAITERMGNDEATQTGGSEPPYSYAPSTTQPIAAQHGDTCVCRHCADGAYLKLRTRADYLQQENTRLERALADARHALKVSEFKRLTLEINAAVKRGDRDAWLKACSARLELGLGDEEAFALMGKAA